MSYLIPYIFLVLISIRNNGRLSKFTSICIWIFLVIFIGFRFEVGADWFNYNFFIEQAENSSYLEFLARAMSPAYAYLLVISDKYKWGIYGLNIITALIFSGGLVYFCSKLKNPYLGLIASYPYLIVVVSMGYVTQASAIGIQLVGLTFYQNSKFKAYYLSILLASLFHTSAFLCLLIPLFDRLRLIKKKSSLLSLSTLGIFFGIFYITFLNKIISAYVNSYFGRQYEADGSFIKLLILVIFAIIFLYQRDKFKISNQQKNLLFSLSTLSILIFLYSLTIKATVSTYRTSLYFYSLQLYVTSYLPDTKFLKISTKNWKILFYGFNFLVLIIWLSFANHSSHWLPYKNILLESFL